MKPVSWMFKLKYNRITFNGNEILVTSTLQQIEFYFFPFRLLASLLHTKILVILFGMVDELSLGQEIVNQKMLLWDFS